MGGTIGFPRAALICALAIAVMTGTAWANGERGNAPAEMDAAAVAEIAYPSRPPGDRAAEGTAANGEGIRLSTETPKRPASGDIEEYEEALARVRGDSGTVSGVPYASSDPDREQGIRERLQDGLERIFPVLRESGRDTAGGFPIDAEDELVQKYVRLYSGASKGIILVSLERCAKYRDMVLGILREYQLPEELVYLPVVESRYNVHNLSRAGALGLWQLMPQRALALGLTINCWIDERKDPEKSTRAAARYLKQLYALFQDWHLALAAYNRGEYGLMRDLRSAQCRDLAQARLKKALPAETERFVPQFMACVLIARDPEKYGLRPAAGRPLRYDRVRIHRTVDLKIAAECAGTTIGEIRELNPALRAWCTPHRQPGFELLLPAGTGRKFLRNIARVKDPNPLPGFVKYRVSRGESLEAIAAQFATTVDRIRRDNRMKRAVQAREDQTLVIRPGKEFFETRMQ